MSDSPVEYSSDEILSANIIEKFKLSRYQYQSIAELHNSKVSHFGVDRTMKRLSDVKKKWQFQRQHVIVISYRGRSPRSEKKPRFYMVECANMTFPTVGTDNGSGT